jgi:hypothetical protein
MGKTVNVRDMKVDTKYKVKGKCKKLLTKVLGGLSDQGHGNKEGWYTLTFDDGTAVNLDWYESYEECFSGGGKSRRNRKSKKSRKSKSRKGKSRKSNRRR